MKKILSLILAAALLCACAFTLTSCGNDLEGTFRGAFFTSEKDTLTVTFGENNAVEFSLSVENGATTYKATGTYQIVADTAEGHDHQLMTFEIKGNDMGILSFLQNTQYTYSIEKVKGAKQLTLTAHSGSVSQNMVLTEVKK